MPEGFQIDEGYNLKKREVLSKPQQTSGEIIYPGGRTAIVLAGQVGLRKLFSSGDEWSEFSPYLALEMFPTGEPWDTVWVVKRDEVVDIPYWPNYKGLSDEDMVCKFSDYLYQIPDQVQPLGVDIIQVVHGWGIPSYDLWTYIEYYIIPTKSPIEDFYFGWWADMGLEGVWSGVNSGYDDIRSFDIEHKVTFHEDPPGWDGDGLPGPVGWKIWPPDDMPPEQIRWTFNTRNKLNHYDEEWYGWMSEGKIDPPNSDSDRDGDHGFSTTSIGPFDLAVGDTLYILVAEVVGIGKEGVLENISRFEELMNRDFALPMAPPPPPLRIEAGNHQVTLRWDALPGQVDPETWRDVNREDYETELQPFEGYRVYKSFYEDGPWLLLDQYDIAGNIFESNTGLVHEYTDYGLLNNVEYYYAVTAFSKPDTITGFESLESGVALSREVVIPGTQVPETVGEIYVVPNPYRGDLDYSSYKPPWEKPDPIRNQQNLPGKNRWTEFDRRMQFVNVPSPSEIKIYTLAGDLVNTLNHNDPEVGIKDWNLTSLVGQTVASGIYLFTVEDKKNGKIQVGKFVIIK